MKSGASSASNNGKKTAENRHTRWKWHCFYLQPLYGNWLDDDIFSHVHLLSPKYFISTAQIFSVVKTWSVKFMLELKWSVALGDRGEIPPELAEFLLAVCPLQSYNWICGYGWLCLSSFKTDLRTSKSSHQTPEETIAATFDSWLFLIKLKT